MRSVARIGRTVGVTLLIAASLLTFPSAIPWMFAVWLAWTTVSLVRTEGKGSAYYPLAVGFGALLIKRIPSSPTLLVLSIATTVAFLYTSWCGRRETASRKLAVVAAPLAALWIAWAAFSWDWHAAASCNHPVKMHASRPVALLGDSLTAGVRPVGGYDRDLAKLISLPLVNLGEEGATSTSALKRLPELLRANPQAIVLELGGNDFIKGESRETVHRNLEAIIAAAEKIGAEVVIVEVPRGFVIDPYRGLERELARRHDLELVADTPIRRLVLESPHAPPGMWTGGPHLSDDGLHPNARGNALLARHVAAALVNVYGEAVLAKPE